MTIVAFEVPFAMASLVEYGVIRLSTRLKGRVDGWAASMAGPWQQRCLGFTTHPT